MQVVGAVGNITDSSPAYSGREVPKGRRDGTPLVCLRKHGNAEINWDTTSRTGLSSLHRFMDEVDHGVNKKQVV